MYRSSRPPQTTLLRHSIIAFLTAIVALLMWLQMASANGTSISESESAAATPVAIAATPVTDESLVEKLPGDEDTALVVGVTAVTVIGLTGLAMLDRKHEVADHDSQSDGLPD